MLLLAAATESFEDREGGIGSNPSLGRAAQPKDLFEGYGLLNPDAAIEAVTLSLSPSMNGTVRSETPARVEWEPRAWGRRVDLRREDLLTLTLSVPATADFDLYLYAGLPDKNGDPQIRASSTSPIDGGSETISFSAQIDETAYVFVKRVSGFGTFTLSADHVAFCGNGVLDPGEPCDPTVPGQASCCSGSCLPASPDTLCDDGDACTSTDHCAQGKCTGDARVCPVPSDECQLSGSCQPASGQCSPSFAASDGSACSLGTCRAGLCLAAGAAGAAGDGGAAGANASAEGGAAGEPDGGRAGQPNSVAAGNAGKNGRQPRATLESDSGCGCVAAGNGRAGSALWIAACLGLFAARRRRPEGACQRTIRH
jgi:MYXO-CTERM domain-containing protein